MRPRDVLDTGPDTVLLWDADGNLFPSEGPAFEASTRVTNRFLEWLGSEERWTAPALRLRSQGRNFRSLAVELAEAAGISLEAEDLQRWVDRENAEVVDHLSHVLRPDPEVLWTVNALAGAFPMAVVSSSRLDRLAGCFTATALDPYFPHDLRYSAQDSLDRPTSKPDPAVYLHAVRETGATAGTAIALEDAVPGVASAVGAGLQTIGNLVFVPPAERGAHRDALVAAGACVVIERWSELVDLFPMCLWPRTSRRRYAGRRTTQDGVPATG